MTSFERSARKDQFRATYDRLAPQRRAQRARAPFFHEEDLRYLRFLIPEGLRVLELGCGTGDVLAALKPAYGVGVDFSPAMVAEARRLHPALDFRVGDMEDRDFVASLPGPFDVILIVDTLGSLDDVQAALESLHPLCTRETRVVVVYYSHLWQPLLKFAEWIGWRAKQPAQNIMSPGDIHSLAGLADFEVIKSESKLLSPLRLLGIGRFVNRFISMLPGIRHLSFRHYSVCRAFRERPDDIRSATVVVPVRNERGNIEPAVQRTPRFCDDLEIIFVEGNSSDGSWEEVQRVAAAYPHLDIKTMRQPGKGKADAVFTAFDAARGDVLMILDGDLTMPPEQLPKFWDAIKSGKGEFINGSRLVYPMEDEAMQFLNLIANKSFSIAFTWLLGQRFTDTLCGTKVLRRVDYERIKRGKAYFGDFDPFGDFDLIFGAAKLNLRCVDVPIRYAARTYGSTQISRFSHGLMLIRMVIFAFFRIKAL
ncbi:glycosyltransferase [Pseudolabrys taiwanensis]|uniref:Glycosyltransferase n=1 Tax=Pseudolabrys taiwanensis TaxID=331696 RepID=A0A346A3N4_9HYPH|nr:glycosyltransferase [Pseudolabrys taiwanensis]AXK83781.1 glycosyltransferase [Pseudolabrys taiwanensis]